MQLINNLDLDLPTFGRRVVKPAKSLGGRGAGPPLGPGRDGSLGRHASRGFTLIEVLIAAVLLVVALVGSLALIIGLLRGNQTTRARDTASFLGQQLLDQLDVIPLSALAAYSLAAYSLTPGVAGPSCYPEGDGTFIEHPVTCATAPAAYVVGWQVCCVGSTGPTGNGCLTIPSGGSGQLQLVNTYTVPVVTNGVTSSVNNSLGLTCEIRVELTWPANPTSGATASNLFQDVSSVTMPPLNFQNHLVLTTIRAQ